MKFNLRHVVAFLLLIAISVGFGFGFDAVSTAIERSQHPRPEELQSSVKKNAQEFGLPESVIWATVKNGSDFASNAVSEDGRIGLMQISPEQFTLICTELWNTEGKDTGLLYDPDTNMRAGCAWLSYLYNRYGIWEHVFAAYREGTQTVDAWLQTPENLSEQGLLIHIPNQQTAEFVEDAVQTTQMYNNLYYAK